jgi:hypothetical protein
LARSRLAAITIGIFAGIVLCEVLVRLITPQTRTPLLAGYGIDELMKLDDRYGWVLPPNIRGQWTRNTLVVSNSLGLRDREYGPKRPDEIRVLSLGDSYAFGHGVELGESYAKRVEGMMAERFPAIRLSVISAGLPGYSTHQMILAFHDLFDVLSPDFVVASFVAGNDVAENAIFKRALEQQYKTPLGLVGAHSHAARLILKSFFHYPIL